MSSASPHYTVLARRFRPQTFSEVVGQAPVAQALRNAIASGRVAHAYLFTGARGVGKTSMARILAKALNCPNIADGNPCNACEICDAISAGQDVDVLEIDGASNRGIDDIRTLRSNVGVKSMRTKYKMYIIDEVHMLTKEAFNALLKTLEEPPPNVKFVFCTTEANKVPDTVLSRCQRFDFATIDQQKIAERLHEIATAEGFEVEPEALELVARRAAGSMRDSQSLFDQLLAFSGKQVTAADVHRLLGTAGDERLIELMEAVVGRRPDAALELVDGALIDGVQLSELVNQLLNYLRDLMVIAAGAEKTPLQSVAGSQRETLAAQAERWGMPAVLAGLQILVDAKTRMQRSGHGRALAELALVRLCLLSEMIDLGTLIDSMKGGLPVSSGGSTPRIAAPTRTVAPASPAKTQPLPTQPAVRAEKSEGTGNVAAVPAAVAEVRFDLAPGSEREFLSKVVARLEDRGFLTDVARNAQQVAIRGPNQLDIVAPAAYISSQGVIAASLAKLETAAGDLAGRPVKLIFKFAEAGNRERAKPASEPAAAKIAEDAFVEKARSIFNATVVKVEGVAPSGGSKSDTEDEA